MFTPNRVLDFIYTLTNTIMAILLQGHLKLIATRSRWKKYITFTFIPNVNQNMNTKRGFESFVSYKWYISNKKRKRKINFKKAAITFHLFFHMGRILFFKAQKIYLEFEVI